MRNLFFIVAGAMFLFVSCQSDDLQIYEAAKPDKATKVKKDFKIKNYAGEIFTNFTTGDFEQIGSGIATHIGQFTEYNTANVFIFAETFVGVYIAANGDEIWYGSDGFKCDDDDYVPLEPCPGEPVTLYYVIDGGTGRFEGAKGEFEIYGTFTLSGTYTGGTGTGWIEY